MDEFFNTDKNMNDEVANVLSDIDHQDTQLNELKIIMKEISDFWQRIDT